MQYNIGATLCIS